MIDEQQFRKDLEGCRHDLTEVLLWHLPGWTEENHKNLCQYNWCPSRDMNQTTAKYKFRLMHAV
jgi:hypothetical protein